MAGKKGRSGAPGKTRPAGPGAKPRSAKLRLGDGIALRVSEGAPLQLGEVTEIMRGIPRTVVITMRSGETVWLLAETPKKEKPVFTHAQIIHANDAGSIDLSDQHGRIGWVAEELRRAGYAVDHFHGVETDGSLCHINERGDGEWFADRPADLHEVSDHLLESFVSIRADLWHE